MKKYLLLVFLLSISITVSYSQKNSSIYNGYRTIWDYNWSDPIAFAAGPQPIVQGFGELSDSLSNAYNVKKFYKHQDEYYAIDSWADYYLWFTNKYWYLFNKNIVEYEYYYAIGNNFEMARFIACENYTGKYYPTAFVLKFTDPLVENRLKDTDFIASSAKQKKRMFQTLKKNPSDVAKTSSFQEYTRFSQEKTATNNNENSSELSLIKTSSSTPVKYGLKPVGGNQKSGGGGSQSSGSQKSNSKQE